jgi:hypothetical protein
MKRLICSLIMVGLIWVVGCEDEERLYEKEITLSIDAPEQFRPPLCVNFFSIEIKVSARDQSGIACSNVPVSLSVGLVDIDTVYIDTLFFGFTSSDGEIVFEWWQRDDLSYLYELHARSGSASTIAEIVVYNGNEGPLGLLLRADPDTISLASKQDSSQIQVWIIYDWGWPDAETIRLECSGGIIEKSIILRESVMYTWWHIPELSSIGRFWIAAEYDTVCGQLYDTVWVTVTP